MKKLSFLFCLLYYNFVFVQNDSIFPNLRAEWDIQYSWDYTNPSYFIGKLSLRKLDENYDTMGLYSYRRNNNFEELLIAKIYTDSLKVYANLCSQEEYIDNFFTNYSPSLPNQYELLYDFSLKIGDTAYFSYRSNDYAIVYDIDTILIQGQNKLRLYLSPDSEGQWVQGLGSTNHPLFPKINYCWECAPNVCNAIMEYDGISVIDTFKYEAPFQCYYASLEEKDLNFIKIYPNPLLSNILNLEFNEVVNPKEIKILDLKDCIVNAPFISNNKLVSFNTENLAFGIYFIEVKINNQLIRKRFIKL